MERTNKTIDAIEQIGGERYHTTIAPKMKHRCKRSKRHSQKLVLKAGGQYVAPPDNKQSDTLPGW